MVWDAMIFLCVDIHYIIFTPASSCAHITCVNGSSHVEMKITLFYSSLFLMNQLINLRITSSKSTQVDRMARWNWLRNRCSAIGWPANWGIPPILQYREWKQEEEIWHSWGFHYEPAFYAEQCARLAKSLFSFSLITFFLCRQQIPLLLPNHSYIK